MRRRTALMAIAFLLTGGLGMQVLAGPKKSRKPPKPLNNGVKYEAYPGTDLAQFIYKTSRREFRVGHSPYQVVRFHVAEFVLITEHVRKYLRPDYKAEIKMAPGRGKPTLMANKNFQGRWKDLIKAHKKLIGQLEKLKFPVESKQAFDEFLKTLNDELFVAQKIAARMFPAQDTRARERLKEELTNRFRSRDTEWFDRLMADFEKEADLSKLYPRFVDLLIQPGYDKSSEFAKRAMAKIGLEFATAVEEEGDITAP